MELLASVDDVRIITLKSEVCKGLHYHLLSSFPPPTFPLCPFLPPSFPPLLHPSLLHPSLPSSDIYLLPLLYLDISGNSLSRLPTTLRLIDSLSILQVTDNPLESPPTQVCTDWDQGWGRTGSMHISECKIRNLNIFPIPHKFC